MYVVGSKIFRPKQLFKVAEIKTTLLFFNIIPLYFNTLFNWHINLLATDFFFQILTHPVFKMWVKQKPNKVALWNKWHFEEKKWRLYSMFKIFSTDICWINIKWGIKRVILRPSYIWDARFLKVKCVGNPRKRRNTIFTFHAWACWNNKLIKRHV